MARVEVVPAAEIIDGDVIADPVTGIRVLVTAVIKDGEWVRIKYRPIRGQLGCRVHPDRRMTRWF